MARASFFARSEPLSVGDMVALTGATAPDGADLARLFNDVAPYPSAAGDEVTFLVDRKLLVTIGETSAGGCFVTPELAPRIAASTLALVTPFAEHAFAQVAAAFYPEASRARAVAVGARPGDCSVHPSARLEDGVELETGAVVGPRAEIGAGTVIGANAVVGADVRIGRRCLVGPCASIVFSLIGNDVIVHAGARLGGDGFGFAPGPDGFVKFPQIGRVIVQDQVEIGANATIDRGALEDTVIGEGTKIDNLVQIAHNVTVGRACAFAAQVGLSGSTRIGDGVVMGGQAGTIPHVTIGDGVQAAGGTGVVGDVAPGARIAGRPHRPFERFLKEMRAVARLVSVKREPSG